MNFLLNEQYILNTLTCEIPVLTVNFLHDGWIITKSGQKRFKVKKSLHKSERGFMIIRANCTASEKWKEEERANGAEDHKGRVHAWEKREEHNAQRWGIFEASLSILQSAAAVCNSLRLTVRISRAQEREREKEPLFANASTGNSFYCAHCNVSISRAPSQQNLFYLAHLFAVSFSPRLRAH